MSKIKAILADKALVNRYKSFIWRLSAMTVIFLVNSVIESQTELGLSGTTVTVLGLVAGEVTKYLNTK